MIDSRIDGLGEILVVYVARVIGRGRRARNVSRGQKLQVLECDRIELVRGMTPEAERLRKRPTFITYVREVARICQLKSRRRRQHAGILALNQPQVLDIAEEEGLFFLMGPPKLPPNWFCRNSARPMPALFAKKSLAFSLSLRKYSYAPPWNALCPTW